MCPPVIALPVGPQGRWWEGLRPMSHLGKRTWQLLCMIQLWVWSAHCWKIRPGSVIPSSIVCPFANKILDLVHWVRASSPLLSTFQAKCPLCEHSKCLLTEHNKYLLTEGEVFTRKSQTETLLYWGLQQRFNKIAAPKIKNAFTYFFTGEKNIHANPTKGFLFKTPTPTPLEIPTWYISLNILVLDKPSPPTFQEFPITSMEGVLIYFGTAFYWQIFTG